MITTSSATTATAAAELPYPLILDFIYFEHRSFFETRCLKARAQRNNNTKKKRNNNTDNGNDNDNDSKTTGALRSIPKYIR